MKKAEKTFFVDNLTQELKSASSCILVDYSGLTVKLQQDLKKRLKQVNARLLVSKNTLFKLAAEKAKVAVEAYTDTVLTGPTALIISEKDPLTPLQVLYKFSQEFELPHLKVGIIEGDFQDKESLEKLAKLPGKDVLYAQVIGSVASPIYGLLGTLQANLQKLLYLLNAKTKS